MHRRDFIKVFVGLAVAWPLVARAQQPESMRRIGVLMPHAADDPQGQTRLATFLKQLHLRRGFDCLRSIPIVTTPPMAALCRMVLVRLTNTDVQPAMSIAF